MYGYITPNCPTYYYNTNDSQIISREFLLKFFTIEIILQ